MPSPKIITCMLALVTSISSLAQITITQDAQPIARIITAHNTTQERTAANILQYFIEQVSGARLPIKVTIPPYQSNDIVIESYTRNKGGGIKRDGFQLTTFNNQLYILGGADNGVIYGAVTLLENYLGIDYWGEHEYNFPQKQIHQLTTY